MPLCGLAEGYQYFGEIYRSRIHFLYPDVGWERIKNGTETILDLSTVQNKITSFTFKCSSIYCTAYEQHWKAM
jgi:hypothetical protein